ncbi:uncharacterized protein LOC121587910 [Anopheles merus]|uniref:uncharacterized protein LOC121587910 n=1 Tax=Anopheles merus TaxID=30066 RepID=UPI001BE44106|nr:uncharacterized protein LOC121587910 [Anopheles merus]XP_041761167.1 uncharacterized protein LOC121587910 [Anopheles merus]
MGSHGRQRTVSMSNEISIAFIRAVKKKPVIWCKQSPEHKNKQAQMNAWMELEVDFEMPWEQLQKKWISLNSSFRHYKKVESEQVGQATDRQTTPKWYAYEELKFLNTATDTPHPDTSRECSPPPDPSCPPSEEIPNPDDEEFLEWFNETFKKLPPKCRQFVKGAIKNWISDPYKIEEYFDE